MEHSRARAGVALIVPTKWHGEMCMRICIMHPDTRIEALDALLDDMAAEVSDLDA